MPKVTGPLMSISASGTVAGTVNYRETKRGSIARIHSQPSGDPSSEQLSIRAINKQVSQAWASVSTEERETWSERAEAQSYSTFNAFFVENFNRVKTGRTIVNACPDIDEETPADLILINDDPPSNPDASGDYYQIEDYGGYDAYERIAPTARFVWSDGEGYYCSELLGVSGEDYHSTGGIDLEDTFFAGPNATGSVHGLLPV